MIRNAIFNRLFGIHPVIAVEIFHDLIEFLTTIFSQYFGGYFFDSFVCLAWISRSTLTPWI